MSGTQRAGDEDGGGIDAAVGVGRAEGTLMREGGQELRGDGARLSLRRAPAVADEGGDGVESRVWGGRVKADKQAADVVVPERGVEAVDIGRDGGAGEMLQDLGLLANGVELKRIDLNGFDGEDS